MNVNEIKLNTINVCCTETDNVARDKNGFPRYKSVLTERRKQFYMVDFVVCSFVKQFEAITVALSSKTKSN